MGRIRAHWVGPPRVIRFIPNLLRFEVGQAFVGGKRTKLETALDMKPRARPTAIIAELVLLFPGFSAMAQRTATAARTLVTGFVVSISVKDRPSI